jgi:hypothetical protein
MTETEGGFTIAADEAIFFLFFLMDSTPKGKSGIWLLLGNEVAFTEWNPGKEEEIRELIREVNPRGRLSYIIIKNIDNELYEYESGVASADGLTPYVVARVYLSYVRGEAMA